MNLKSSLSNDPSLPVQYLKGVGPKMAEKLAKLEIHTVRDLLNYFPYRWEDRSRLCSIQDAPPNQEVTVQGEIVFKTFSETRGGFAIANVLMKDSTGQLECKWIRKKNYKYDVFYSLKRDFEIGKILIVHGKLEPDFASKNMIVEDYELMNGAEEDLIHMNRIVPVYAAAEGINGKFLRKLIYHLLESAHVPDPLPLQTLSAKNFLPLETALKKYHFPESFAERDHALQRLAFQELFFHQTVLSMAKSRRKKIRHTQYEIKKNLLTPFRERLGFEFTPSQKKVIREIFDDLTSNSPMNRLLQGDVGSGKTVVALSAMLLACENKLQSVLMAPTEILAEQHYITMKYLLDSLPVRIGLLTGSLKSALKKEFLKECAEGSLHIAVGTHALLEENVQFKQCGLVVIDEQHRFGVRHRLKLSQKNPLPDTLVMTATPIPRTLALGLYGDLDVSTIDQLPPGRQKIETLSKSEEEAYQIVKMEVGKKHQAYIVFPLVDESDKIELKSAIQAYENLKSKIFKDIPIGLLHGQMPGGEKEKIMNDFAQGRFAILITTTIIEVGIDVANASVIVIQNAERFGLSTLHQLRGRVGRGKAASRCILVSQKNGEEAKKRIDIFLNTDNGFELAEADLKIRGPGEVFGTLQHGMPSFKVADLFRDRPLIVEAREAAGQILQKDPDLASQEHAALREHLRKHYSKTWHWATIA